MIFQVFAVRNFLFFCRPALTDRCLANSFVRLFRPSRKTCLSHRIFSFCCAEISLFCRPAPADRTETYVRMIKCSGVYSVNLRAYSLSHGRDKFCLPQFTADPQILSQRLISSLLPKFFLRGRAANSFFRKVFCRNHNKSVKVDTKAYLLALVVRGNLPSLAGPIL